MSTVKNATIRFAAVLLVLAAAGCHPAKDAQVPSQFKGTPEKPWSYGLGEVVGYAAAQNGTEDVIRVGSFAYVCAKSNGVLVFDLTDPKKPVLVNQLQWGNPKAILDAAWKASLDHSLLAIAYGNVGVVLLDVTNPASPKELGVWSGGFDVRCVQVYGPVIIAGGHAGHLATVNGVNMQTMSLIQVGAGDGLLSLARGSNVIYAGDAAGNLHAIDAKNLATLSPIASAKLDKSWVSGLALVGNKIYAATYYSGLVIVDVSSLKSLKVLASILPSNLVTCYDVWCDGKRAYVATNSYLSVIDVSIPNAPLLVKNVDVNVAKFSDMQLHGVEVAGDAALVAINTQGFLAVVSIKE